MHLDGIMWPGTNNQAVWEISFTVKHFTIEKDKNLIKINKNYSDMYPVWDSRLLYRVLFEMRKKMGEGVIITVKESSIWFNS